MMWRRISLTLAKYIAIALCLVTLLLTTPWGTRLTLALLDNFDSVTIDYQRGSLVRDVQLNAFHLKLDNLDLVINGLSTELDFSCAWKKILCIKSIKADELSLHYIAKENLTNENIAKENPTDVTAATDLKQETANKAFFEIPFAIKADSIALKKIHLVINKTELSVNQFITRVAINKHELTLVQPSVKQLTVLLEKEQKDAAISQSETPSLASVLAQLSEINLPISFIIKKLAIKDIAVQTKESNYQENHCQKNCQEKRQQLWQSSNNQLSAAWVHTDVSISQFQTTTPAFSISQLTANAKLQPPYQINSQLVSHLNNVPLWPEIANTTQHISLQGSFENLAFELSSQGNLALTSQGELNLIDKDMPFNITMSAEKIPMPLSLAQYGKPSSLSLMLFGSLKEQTIELTSQLKSYGYNNAQVKLLATHQQGQFSIEDLRFNDTDSASQLILNGDIAILPANITWQLSAKSTGISLPKINLQGLTSLLQGQTQIDAQALNIPDSIPDSITGRLQGNITSKGAWSEKHWAISIRDTEISGKINDSALSIKSDIGFNQSGRVEQGKLLVAFNNNKLTLQASDHSFWDLTGSLAIDDINQWYRGINGAFTSNFSVSGEKNNPVIRLTSQASQLHWQHWYSNSLKIEGVYQPMNDHQIKLTLNNDQLKWVNENKIITVDDFNFNVTGDAKQHQIQVHWLGDVAGQLALTGHWNDTFTHWQSVIEKSALTYQGTRLENDKTFALNFDLANYYGAIEPHCWQRTGVSICLPNQAIVGNSGDIFVKLNVDLSVIDELFLPKDVEIISQFNGDIEAKWSKQQSIKANAHFALSSGYVQVSDEFSEYPLSQWSQGEFSFALDEQLFTSKLQLTDTHNKPLMHINSTIKFIDDFPVDTKIVLNQFNLQPFQSLLAAVVNLQGNLTADITVEGTLNSPLINGGITLEQGKLRLNQNANVFDNITTTLTIENNQATLLSNFFLEDKEANLTGNISWQDSLTLNVDLHAETLPLVFPPQLVMSIAPSLNFTLKEKTLAISGNIDVLDGIYNIEKLPEGSVSLSDDVIIVDQNGQPMVKKSTSFDINTNISVKVAKAFKVSGQGLQSHLLGQLQISQKEKQPFQLFGRIQSDDGTFKAYGQNLKIEKGELTFNGPIDNPYLDLRASRYIKAEDVEVGIQVTGLADALDMKLFSSPLMQVPEMLSYLVRGRSLDAGTGNTAAAAGLLVGFGITNNIGLFEQIEKIPLINNLAVDTEGDGDKTQATVSGYLGNRVYLKYGIGVYEPINELTVRMYMFNRFWLEIVSGIEQSTDIYYSFDID